MPGPLGLDEAVGLLEHALDYTRPVLAHLDDAGTDGPADLTRPTPCTAWDLGRLLAHMEDGLDAFTEGADGTVSLDPRVPAEVRAARLRRKACHLLGSWLRERPAVVSVGSRPVPTAAVAATATLEITIHGWDVAQTLGLPTPLPVDLAVRLGDLAEALVDPTDRGRRFATPLPVPADADAEARLLAFLGRDRCRPGGANPAVRQT